MRPRVAGPAEMRRTAVPVEAVVLGGDAVFRPGEVELPGSAAQVNDLVLQHGRRQAAVEHDQPCLALHRRLGQRGGQPGQLPSRDNAAPPGMPLEHAAQFVASAGAAAQRGVQRRQGSWLAQAARHLDSRPRGHGGRPRADDGQRRARTAMHQQTAGRSQLLATRVQHVQVRILFGVEAVRGRCGAQTDRDRRACRQIQAARPQRVGDFTAAVNAVPNLLQHTAFQVHLQAAAGEVGQRLGGGSHAALHREQSVEVRIHARYRQRTAARPQFTPCRACAECRPKAACPVQTRTLAGVVVAVRKPRPARRC